MVFGASSKQVIDETLRQVKAHIDAKMKQARVEEHPFPHIVIEGIFPEQLYKHIQSKWPAKEEFVRGGQRNILPATNGCIESSTLTTEQKVFWTLFGEIIVNKYIKPQLIEKLLPYIGMKHRLSGLEPSQVNYFTDFSNLRQDCLVEDDCNYSIAAHIDQLNIFAALLIYLPSDTDHQDMGTTFYSGPPNPDPNNIYRAPALKFAKRIPYKPNTLVVFLQSPISWHAVEATRHTNYRRKLYMAPIFSPLSL